MCGKALKYDIIRTPYNKNAQVSLDARCNGFTLKNTGTTLLNWDGEYLTPGQSVAVGGNVGEVFQGRVDIFFKTQSPAPSTITNAALVTQKVYIEIDL